MMSVSINRGTPKWMVHSGESQSKISDLGVPPISGNLQIMMNNHWICSRGTLFGCRNADEVAA